MSLKLFHIADLHLGRSFRNLPEAQAVLSEARYETLRNTVRQANEEEADIFVIAGDLFDRTSVNVGDIQKAAKAINEFSGEIALVLPGNHDYITPDSDLWNRFDQETEEHVQVLAEKSPVELSVFEMPVVIYPAPCHAKHAAEHAIGWVDDEQLNTEAINIGIAHGSIEGVSPDFDQRYFPMTVRDLENAGMDLWLMGHTHITWPEKPDKRDIIFNPGTPEPDGFACTHEGRAFMFTIDKEKHIETELVSTGTHRFVQANAQVTDTGDITDLIESYSDASWNDNVLWLRVSGKLEEEAYELWQKRKAELRESVLELRLDDEEVRRRVTGEQIKREFSEGSFPERLLSSFSEEEEEDELQMAYELMKEVQ